MRDRCCLPFVLEPEDVCAGGHGIQDETGFTMTPMADEAALVVFGEAGIAELGLELVELGSRRDFDDDVDVISRAEATWSYIRALG